MWKAKKKFLVFSVLTLALGHSASKTASASERLLMAALGDSITAGSMSDVPLLPSAEAPALRAENSKPIVEDKENLSWASGRVIPSHYKLLSQHLKVKGENRPLDILNVATPGNTSQDLENQAREVAKAMASGKYAALKYVTILIGANDVCTKDGLAETPSEQMRKNLQAAFSVLSQIQQNEPIRILVLGLPRIPALGAPRYRKASTLLGLSCETLRGRILHFCDSLLHWDTPEEFGEKMGIVEEKNRLLQDFVLNIRKSAAHLDVVYTNRLQEADIPLNFLAADCFHPSMAGQIAISMQTWQDQPWFK